MTREPGLPVIRNFFSSKAHWCFFLWSQQFSPLQQETVFFLWEHYHNSNVTFCFSWSCKVKWKICNFAWEYFKNVFWMRMMDKNFDKNNEKNFGSSWEFSNQHHFRKKNSVAPKWYLKWKFSNFTCEHVNICDLHNQEKIGQKCLKSYLLIEKLSVNRKWTFPPLVVDLFIDWLKLDRVKLEPR
jgi:hypothetical protein